MRRGQRGRLRLTSECLGGGTVLAERHTSAPFGAVRANRPDGSGVPEGQITNPSGGIVGGDRLEADMEVAPGSAATLLTQAANKAYRGEEAFQRTVLRVGGGAFLEYLPHHLIPHAGSNHRQEMRFSAGRVTRGERFAFDRLRARTSVLRDGVPEVVDGFDLADGSERFGGFSYAAAVYVLSPGLPRHLSDALHGALASGSAPRPEPLRHPRPHGRCPDPVQAPEPRARDRQEIIRTARPSTGGLVGAPPFGLRFHLLRSGDVPPARRRDAPPRRPPPPARPTHLRRGASRSAPTG